MPQLHPWTCVLITQGCPGVPGSFYLPLHLGAITTSQLLLPIEGYYPQLLPLQGYPTCQLFLRSLLFWHQLKRILLSSLRVVSLFDSIVVFLNLMPIVQDSYCHLLKPLKGRDNIIVDKADLPGSCLRKMAKGVKYKMLVFSS